MKIVKNLIGWLLVIWGFLGIWVFSGWLYTIVYFRTHYTQQFQSPLMFDCRLWGMPSEILVSVIISLTGFLLTRHKFGNNALKDKIILGVLCTSLAAWAIILYLMVGYRWN